MLLLILVAPLARAQLVVEITQGQADAIPIAIVPFAADAGAPTFDVAQVVAADLGSSGRFAPMSRDDMIEKPTHGADIVFNDWRTLKADYIVVGRVQTLEPNRYQVAFELFNVLNRQRLLGFQITANQSGLRLASHQIADLIYEKIIGVKGAFATRIAYISVTGHVPNRQYRLIVADADGADPRVVMQSGEPLMSPAWSPDGQNLAYVSFENQLPAIYVQYLKSGERRRVSAKAGVNQAPAWSPDGRRLALTLSSRDGNLDIYVLDLATQALTRVTSDPSIDTEPQWSRDGQSLYFTSDRAGGPQIYKQSLVPGSRAQRVTFQGPYNARPRLSPDESQLAFVTQDGSGYHIAVQDLTGRGDMQVLTKGRFDESPSFAPNGAVLIYSSRDHGRGVLALVSTDGRVQQRLVSSEGEVREPAWAAY
ncbi:MAG: Tol-Pal system beta propeller repeat protein TolB [Proteobacteria bacterium]|nr:Tol-Pal system beta propeller repeat protein TolB [Pseudomonadota bacterium]